MSGQTFSAATLVVFCRRPAPGVGKQRIAAGLGAEFARELGDALLATALEDARDWPGPVILAPAAAGDHDWARQLGPDDWQVLDQGDGNLGQRLNTIDALARARGHEQLVYIGSDAPLLDAAYFEHARQLLQSNDVVLGPADDGGVTLMAARKPWPALQELPWSSDALGAALATCCEQTGYRIDWLPQSADVDRPEDLPLLMAALAADPRPARRALHDWLAEQLGKS